MNRRSRLITDRLLSHLKRAMVRVIPVVMKPDSYHRRVGDSSAPLDGISYNSQPFVLLHIYMGVIHHHGIIPVWPVSDLFRRNWMFPRGHPPPYNRWVPVTQSRSNSSRILLRKEAIADNDRHLCHLLSERLHIRNVIATKYCIVYNIIYS